MLSDKSTVCPINLLDIAHQKRGAKAAIVNAGKRLPMLSVMDSVKEKLIIPVLIGDEIEIISPLDEVDTLYGKIILEIVQIRIHNNDIKPIEKYSFDTTRKNGFSNLHS